MSILIKNALIPTTDGYESTDIRLEGDRIAAIAPNLQVTDSWIDATNKLILPGFVNAHTHSSQIWQRGLIRPLPLELWLADVFDAAPSLSLEELYWSAVSTAVDTLLSGGTCLLDHILLPWNQELEGVATVAQAYRDVGIRAFIAPLIMDEPFLAGLPRGRSHASQPYPRSAEHILALMETIIQRFHQPEVGIHIAVGPTGFHRCSDELLQGCIELSDRYDLCRHMHLLETKAQKLLAQEKYNSSAVQHLQQLGFLDHRTTLAHAVWLDDSDLATLAETRSTVVHNPLSNLRLGSGIAPVLKCLGAGVNVTFGCDGAASNDAQDLLEVLKLATILSTIKEPDYRQWLTCRQTLHMATLGGAKGVNLSDQTGELTVGKKADLVMYDLTNLSLLPRTDPIQLLILGRPTQVVESVWVDGKLVVASNQPLGIQLEVLRQALVSHSQNRHPIQFQTIQQVEPLYRSLLSNF
ncbi:cytosine deaminase-like metal-dependent hydrolase [Leptolyngbyaceae cyanobacterium JSC-12]|nr:cytosine deaminase-like metal-dependent hydrolase [Leptolyngbyaceae cyanobacterium JSC-12]